MCFNSLQCGQLDGLCAREIQAESSFPLLGRSYDAAVMSAGQVGFSLGATPNAVANMKAVVEQYGPSPRAFLVVPVVVGGFLIDFLNALNITVFLNRLKP